MQSVSQMEKEGLLKKNCKNDKTFNVSIDNMIYQYQDEED